MKDEEIERHNIDLEDIIESAKNALIAASAMPHILLGMRFVAEQTKEKNPFILSKEAGQRALEESFKNGFGYIRSIEMGAVIFGGQLFFKSFKSERDSSAQI